MKPHISIGHLLDRAWEHYESNFKSLVKISAWMYVNALLQIIVTALYPIDRELGFVAFTFTEKFAVVLQMATFFVLIAITLWTTYMLIKSIHAQAVGERINLPLLSAEAWKNTPHLLLVLLLTIVTIALSAIIPVGLYWIWTNVTVASLPTTVTIMLLLFTSLLFIVPMALVVYFTLTSFSYVLDGYKGVKALKHGVELIEGHFWPTFMRVLVAIVIYLFIFGAVQRIAEFVGKIVILMLVTADQGVLFFRLLQMVNITTYVSLVVFVNPLLFAVYYYLYRDLKEVTNA